MIEKKKRAVPGLSLIEQDLDRVEKILRKEARSEVRLVMDVGSHILASGGKRFRPMLTLLSGRLIGFHRKKELLGYAAGVEFAHNSTLLHDDVIDEADVRRGETAANRLWGNAPSIIVGDYLLFKAFWLSLVGGNLTVIKYMSNVAIEMAEGEAYQLALKSKVGLSEKEYERIIKAKTALLIQASCQIPAIAAGVPSGEEKALKKFGYHLGLAFQMVDDVLDYAATDKKWGKQVGKDFMEGKTTLPIIIAFQGGSARDREVIRALFKKKNRTKKELARIMAILNGTAALDKSMDRARAQVRTAKRALSAFPDRPAKKALLGLADYVVERSI